MGVTLNKLVFDSANPSDSANVGAYLRASDGTLITHTGGKLDVQVGNTVTVSATDLDIRDIDASQDNIAISDGTDTLAVNADGSINSVVSATDLDIRNLVFATDKVDVSGSSVTVSATNLDIRDLTHVSDSVKIGDGTDFLAVNADGSLNTKPAGSSSAAYGATTVTTTATDLIGTDLSGRFSVLLQNVGSKDVYIGSNASVTTANGILLAAGSSVILEAGSTINMHGITSSGSASVRYFELAA